MELSKRFCVECQESVEPLPGGSCPQCLERSWAEPGVEQAAGAIAGAAEVQGASDAEPAEPQVPGFPWNVVLMGTLIVCVTYIIGSAIHWQTGIGKLVDLRTPQHIGTVIGFWATARLAQRHFFMTMVLVFALSFLLTGIYEELWRRVAWNAGYIWGYHGFTLPFWALAFVAGGLAGYLMNKRAERPRSWSHESRRHRR